MPYYIKKHFQSNLTWDSKDISMADNSTKEVVTDLSPFIKVYKDGSIERLISFPNVPPSLVGDSTGVSSKDISISPEVSARVYLPKLTNHKLPILIYYHGGGFCIGSVFSFIDYRYMNLLSYHADALIISVEYRLAPEHPLPAAYEDSWTALQWIASHAVQESEFEKEPWLVEHGDLDKIYIGGDSAGANIVHNIAMRAGLEPLQGGAKILRAFLCYPYFLGTKPAELSAPEGDANWDMLSKTWKLAYPSAAGGIDNAMINPLADDAPPLSGMGCEKMLVCLAEKDVLTARGRRYVEGVKKSGWRGVVEMVVVDGEDHCFHVFDPDTEKAKTLIKRIASFIC